jgi:penicillin-binding protein 1C
MTLTSSPAARDGGLKSWINRALRPKIFLTLSAAVLALLLTAFWISLPKPLFNTPYASVILDKQGRLMGATIAADQQWRFPPRTQLPPRYQTAVVQYEDKRFFYHPGVDPIALARAIYQDLKAGKVISGASTLSMQVIRMSRGNPPRTYIEKLLETVLALRLELGYSKKEILALYAAHAPFGGNTVGLEAASWRYFGRPPTELTWAEAALLAVLPNNPSLIHPGRRSDALRAKRNALLQRLKEKHVISDLDWRAAVAEGLPDAPRPLPRYAPHLHATLQQQYPMQSRFVTSVDLDLQKMLNNIVAESSAKLRAHGIDNLAVLVLDNVNFNVLGYVGNSPPSGDAQMGTAVDIIRRPRSTGSVLKPFLFAAMLEHGELTPTMLVPDVPTHYEGYAPKNYDRRYRGAVPANMALARSLNIPAVRMLRRYGVERFYDVLRQMGMSTLNRPPEDYGLTLILGGAEGSLWDLTRMYANLAHLARQNQYAYQPRYREVRPFAGKPGLENAAADISPGAAWLTLQALVNVTRPDTERFWKRFQHDQPIAWKTGTSYGLRDAWAIGTDAKYTVGVWAGNADGAGRAGLSGLRSAAPVLFKVFNTLPHGGWFTRPDTWLRPVTVCRKDGYLADDLCRKEVEQIPRNSHFHYQSPHFQLVHLDPSRKYQVHSGCQPVADMVHEARFQLPPAQAYFYRQHHADYESLPPYRKDCQSGSMELARPDQIELLYPQKNTRLYIPTDLGARRSKTVFQAADRDPQARIYWHLDDTYLATTRVFHELALDIQPGRHVLVLVDNYGNRLVRPFEVLAKPGKDRR